MIYLLSPAKNMDFKRTPADVEFTDPVFIKEAQALSEKLKTLSPKQISKLMNINATLGQLNFERYQAWGSQMINVDASASLFAFTGEVYRGLSATDFRKEDIDFAQDHLRILSGLYGVLRPKDRIMPYRLEMGTRLEVKRSVKNLYQFWENKLRQVLNDELQGHKNAFIINLASNEYIKAVAKKSLNFPMINCHFLDWKAGKFQSVMTWAKLARGKMARSVIKNKVDDLKSLKNLSFDNYKYDPSQSDEYNFVFARKSLP